MRLFALGFVAGTLLLQQAAELPGFRVAPAAAACALARGLPAVRAAMWVRGALPVLAGSLLGFDHAAWRAQARLADELPFAWEGRDVAVTGLVSGLAQPGEKGTRFLFDVEAVETPRARVPSRMSLMWYAGEAPPPRLVPGERWRLAVRAKRPRGLANPHAFDFEPWALERGIRATGYVRASGGRLAQDVAGWPGTLDRWRGEIRERMLAHLGEGRLRGVLVALAIGDQDAIASGDWRVFWRTGVGHLMSISGLHITMLAGLAFAVVAFLWVRCEALALRIPAPKAGAVAAALASLAYSLLTGFAVPAQRTFTMVAVIAAAVLSDRHGSPSRVLAAAALAVLLADPWAVLSSGFWLSFGAVGAIFYVFALRTASPGRLRRAAVEQLAVTVVMLPMLAALFQEVSLVSPLANAFAIPVVSLAVVPLTLAGAFLPLAAALDLAHGLMLLVMAPLEWLAALSGAVMESHAPPAWCVAAAVAGCAWLLAPRGLPMRWAGALWLLPLATVLPPKPAQGEAWVDLLDVGNGLAVVVRTAGHALVYDAGPAWSAESDAGGRIVAPYLRGEGVRRLDGLVVSHSDDDHAGGAASVAAARSPGWLLSPLASGHPLHWAVPISRLCSAGMGWEWEGVRFAVLHPAEASHSQARRRENDRSCVIRIATRGGVALLAGDAQARSEAEMLARDRRGLAAQVLVVPHHGSRSSSTRAFLAAVDPRVALFSVGWRNRFGHPHPAVEARYRERGAVIARTDEDGALRVALPAQAGGEIAPVALAGRLRYWSDRRATR